MLVVPGNQEGGAGSRMALSCHALHLKQRIWMGSLSAGAGYVQVTVRTATHDAPGRGVSGMVWLGWFAAQNCDYMYVVGIDLALLGGIPVSSALLQHLPNTESGLGIPSTSM